MSSFDLLSVSLGRALDCARRIAESSGASLNGLHEPQNEIRRLRRDLPHLNQQVMAVFAGDERLADDLRQELTCVEDAGCQMADWVILTQKELRELLAAGRTDPDAYMRFGPANHEAHEEYGRQRQAVLESCERAYLVSHRVCSAIDKASIARPTVAARNPVAASGFPLPGNDPTAIPKRAEVPEETVSKPPSRDDQIQQLEPAVRRAYLAYEYAEMKAVKRLEDREAYDLLKEEGIPEGYGNRGNLAEYEPPAFDTWAKYLRTARKLLGESKYTPRKGRPTGKSVVSANQIEPPKTRGKQSG